MTDLGTSLALEDDAFTAATDACRRTGQGSGNPGC